MTVAYVKGADGTGGLVQNTFLDSAGTTHTLIAIYIGTDLIPYTVFWDLLPTSPPAGQGQLFRVTETRVYVATDQRIFRA
jgi:hypothetical protein